MDTSAGQDSDIERRCSAVFWENQRWKNSVSCYCGYCMLLTKRFGGFEDLLNSNWPSLCPQFEKPSRLCCAVECSSAVKLRRTLLRQVTCNNYNNNDDKCLAHHWPPPTAHPCHHHRHRLLLLLVTFSIPRRCFCVTLLIVASNTAGWCSLCPASLACQSLSYSVLSTATDLIH